MIRVASRRARSFLSPTSYVPANGGAGTCPRWSRTARAGREKAPLTGSRAARCGAGGTPRAASAAGKRRSDSSRPVRALAPALSIAGSQAQQRPLPALFVARHGFRRGQRKRGAALSLSACFCVRSRDTSGRWLGFLLWRANIQSPGMHWRPTRSSVVLPCLMRA